LVGKSLARAVESPNDLAARTHMAWAATLGGASIANAGMTVTHGISQALGGRFHLPHGESAAVCLPESMETMLEARADRFALVADAMGFSEPGMNVTERAQRCVAGVRQLRKAVGLEIPLREFGISSDDLDQVAQDVFETQQWSIEHHPCELSKDDVRGILQTCL